MDRWSSGTDSRTWKVFGASAVTVFLVTSLYVPFSTILSGILPSGLLPEWALNVLYGPMIALNNGFWFVVDHRNLDESMMHLTTYGLCLFGVVVNALVWAALIAVGFDMVCHLRDRRAASREV